jgi:arsenate reductase-like glutaredoxin family protein
MGKVEALKLAQDVNELYVMKGSKIVHVDLRKDKPDSDTLAGMLLGPTGNLRAPTLKVGKTLLVGFNEEAYSKVV